MTDRRTLPTIQQELLHAAAIIRTLHWQKLDPNKDYNQQIKDIIIKEQSFIESISENGEIEASEQST